MSNANLGWLYYKELYKKGNNDTHIQSTFEYILKVNAKDESFTKEHSFELTTLYPGLIIGSGYTHGLSSDEDTKMGFYFDFTTGLPTIPGSSIKGVLRSLFGYNEKELYKREKSEFINTRLGKDIDTDALAEQIFEGTNNGKKLSIYNRDKFYEARIVRTSGSILQEDYITPHKETLKNPVPLKIVKIRGGTTFEFSFDLVDSDINGTLITADEKEKLFFQLLQFHGLGAKTNVGYGQFEEKTVEKFTTEKRLKQDSIAQEREKEETLKKEAQAQKDLKLALLSADTTVKKIELAIAPLPAGQEMLDIIASYELTENEKSELITILKGIIGEMPEKTDKNMKKAKTKWPIRIYELLGL